MARPNFCSQACKEEFESDPEMLHRCSVEQVVVSGSASSTRYCYNRGTGLPLIEIHRSECI
jgi:hypothetical protein